MPQTVIYCELLAECVSDCYRGKRPSRGGIGGGEQRLFIVSLSHDSVWRLISLHLPRVAVLWGVKKKETRRENAVVSQ